MIVYDGKEHEVQKLISIDVLEVQSYYLSSLGFILV
jgi:hypothetical protein